MPEFFTYKPGIAKNAENEHDAGSRKINKSSEVEPVSEETLLEVDPELEELEGDAFGIAESISENTELPEITAYGMLLSLGAKLKDCSKAAAEYVVSRLVDKNTIESAELLWRQREVIMKLAPFYWKLAKYGPLRLRKSMTNEERELREFIADHMHFEYPDDKDLAGTLEHISGTFSGWHRSDIEALTDNDNEKPLYNIAHSDAFRLYLGLEQRFNTFRPARYTPTMRSGNLNAPKYETHRIDNIIGLAGLDDENWEKLLSEGRVETVGRFTWGAMGRFTLYLRGDEGGNEIISGYDGWDLDPAGLQVMGVSPIDVLNRPFDIYFRIEGEDIKLARDRGNLYGFSRELGYDLENLVVQQANLPASDFMEELTLTVLGNEDNKALLPLFAERFNISTSQETDIKNLEAEIQGVIATQPNIPQALFEEPKRRWGPPEPDVLEQEKDNKLLVERLKGEIEAYAKAIAHLEEHRDFSESMKQRIRHLVTGKKDFFYRMNALPDEIRVEIKQCVDSFNLSDSE